MSWSQRAEQVLFSYLWVCANVYECVHVAVLDDMDWLIQGRVCALSEHLLFHSHMDLGPLMESPRPDLVLSRRRINSSQQKCSAPLLTQAS